MAGLLEAFAGPLIGAAASLFGGKKSKESAADQAVANYLQQKEFAQHGIRWRVEDAKAAGLHPLYALQGSGATFSPNPIVTTEQGTFESMGQNLSRAAQAALSSRERTAQDDLIAQQIRESKSREALNVVQAQAVESKRRLDEAAQFTDFPGPGPFAHIEGQGTTHKADTPSNTVIPGQFQGKPHEILSPRGPGSNTLAGPPEARYREAQVGPAGVTLLLPHQGGQFQEDMTMVDIPSWIAANVDAYGWNGFLGRWMFGREKMARTYKWDAPVINAIQRFIDRNSNARR